MPARAASVRRCVLYAVGLAGVAALWLLLALFLGAGAAHASDGPAEGHQVERRGFDRQPAGKTAGPVTRTVSDAVREGAQPAARTATRTVRQAVATTPAARPADTVVESAVDAVDRVVAEAADAAVGTARTVEGHASSPLPAPSLPAPVQPGGDAGPGAAADQDGDHARAGGRAGGRPAVAEPVSRPRASGNDATAAPAVLGSSAGVVESVMGDSAPAVEPASLPAAEAATQATPAALADPVPVGFAVAAVALLADGVARHSLSASYLPRPVTAVPGSAPDGLPVCTPD